MAEAQQGYETKCSSVEVSWGPSVPIHNSFWKVNPVGVLNFSLRYEYRLLPVLGLGFQAGLDYHSYEGYTEESYNYGILEVGYAGNSVRNQLLVPFIFSARYYPLGESETLLRPYVGLGLGTTYSRMYITGDTIFTQGYANWGFAVSPEIGVRVHVLPDFFVDLKCLGLWSTDAWVDFTGDKSTLVFYPQLGVGLAF